MAEINKKNLVDETAAVYAANTLASNPKPLFSTGTPAKIVRASIANTNLLSNDGDLFVGTGGTYTETIDGTEYTYAKIAKKNQSELFVNGLNSTATNVGLAASVGKFIDDRLHISKAVNYGSTTSIVIGRASTSGENAVAIGNGADVSDDCDQGISIGYNAKVLNADNIAIGNGSEARAVNCIELGSGINETANSFQVGSYQMLDLNTGKIPLDRINYQVGQEGTTTISLGGTPGTTLGNTVYGINATTTNTAADATAIGYSASASGGSVALGAQAYCRKNAAYGIAIGFKSALGKETEVGNLDSCIAIGNEAKIDNSFYKKDAIQLGTGTNSAGGFQVWDYQLMNSSGIIPLERRPTYRCRLTKQVTVGGGNGVAVRTYAFEWYSSSSSKGSAIFDNFSVFGYEEKVISSSSTNTYNLYNAVLRITKNTTINESETTIYVDDDTSITKISGKLSEFTFTAQLI